MNNLVPPPPPPPSSPPAWWPRCCCSRGGEACYAAVPGCPYPCYHLWRRRTRNSWNSPINLTSIFIIVRTFVTSPLGYRQYFLRSFRASSISRFWVFSSLILSSLSLRDFSISDQCHFSPPNTGSILTRLTEIHRRHFMTIFWKFSIVLVLIPDNDYYFTYLYRIYTEYYNYNHTFYPIHSYSSLFVLFLKTYLVQIVWLTCRMISETEHSSEWGWPLAALGFSWYLPSDSWK